MEAKLNEAERQYALRFISSAEALGRRPAGQVWVAALVLMLAGLVLAFYAVDVYLGNLTPRTQTYVLLPGVVGGLVLIAAGAAVARSAARASARRRLAAILRKLLAEQPEAPEAPAQPPAN